MVYDARELSCLRDDVYVFADMGTEKHDFVLDTEKNHCLSVIRNGEKVKLTFLEDGSVIETLSSDGEVKKHISFSYLLASSRWANFTKWAHNQVSVFEGRKPVQDEIEIYAALKDKEEKLSHEVVDDFFSNARKDKKRVSVLLVNGPAGIGKTTLISSLCYRRAQRFLEDKRGSLILHVESRGRMLQNITDLIAFSLQTLRVGVTYDQVPALIRRGLLILAVDGFDELGDPSGYQLAWAQVNDLIKASRSGGQLIFSGRETFIEYDRVKKALSSIEDSCDLLETCTLKPVRTDVAKKWLGKQGWNQEDINSDQVKPLLDTGSYVLRPFFLTCLADKANITYIKNNYINDFLSFLIDRLILRETEKFGNDIENNTEQKQRAFFIEEFMKEVARDVADAQSSAIPFEIAKWLGEEVAREVFSSSLERQDSSSQFIDIIKNRIEVLPFFENDARSGYKKFGHEEYYNFFLAKDLISSLSEQYIPKYVRRNILGVDFIKIFLLLVEGLNDESFNKFIESSKEALKNANDSDRSKQNIASILMASFCASQAEGYNNGKGITIRNVSIDEVYMTGIVSPITLEIVTINQLVSDGADMSNVSFDEKCHIISLVVEEGSLVGKMFPIPQELSKEGEVFFVKSEVQKKMESIGRYCENDEEKKSDIPDEKLELLKLFNRVCRYKFFWIKDDNNNEKAARLILENPHWDNLKSILREHDYLTEKKLQSSGVESTFYHVKNKKSLMDLNNLKDYHKDLYNSLIG